MGELRLTIRVGFWRRGAVRAAVEDYCFQRGFGCWIESVVEPWFRFSLRVVITAPSRYIGQVKADMEYLLS